jgi:hypothetical protein
MYDSVNENPDAPHKDIIDDNDALDGWFIEQRRKRDIERNEKTITNISNIHEGAGEVFLPAQSKEDLDRIHGMNTLESKIIKLQREGAIKRAGELSESQLPDKQMELRRMAMEQMTHHG